MIAASTFRDKNVALFGLGGSGLASALALGAGGAQVSAWDDSAAAREAAKAKGVALVDLAKANWQEFSSLVLAPGVPLTHPAPHWSATRARDAEIEIIGDIEIFCRERARLAPHSPFIAITGTNGKSTTTALLTHLLTEFGHHAEMGGNIGRAILSLSPPAPKTWHVIECSSFQIDLAPGLDPTIGVLLNITPDHLDRHGAMDNYADIKARLVAHANLAIIGVDDELCLKIATQLRASGNRVRTFSIDERKVEDGIVIDGTKLLRKQSAQTELLADIAGISSLRGSHNAQNAAAALAALGDEALDRPRLQAALASFPGLPHRMEEVGRLGTVLFINDSKATNADAAEKALASFENIFWIAGGKAKEGGIQELRPYFNKIRSAYLIGEASADFAQTLGKALPHQLCGTLETAVAAAARDAMAAQLASSVVLLSPACASYDQYRNFELRGDAFRRLARAAVQQHQKIGA